MPEKKLFVNLCFLFCSHVSLCYMLGVTVLLVRQLLRQPLDVPRTRKPGRKCRQSQESGNNGKLLENGWQILSRHRLCCNKVLTVLYCNKAQDICRPQLQVMHSSLCNILFMIGLVILRRC